MTDTGTSVLFNSSDSVCLLKTAVAKVVSDTCSDSAKILFNEGAQHSFISRKYFAVDPPIDRRIFL